MLVKLKRRAVACPNVQRNVVKPVLFCKVKHIFVKTRADMTAADVFVNAQIVNVKRFYVAERIVVLNLDINAKSISGNLTVLFRNENRTFVIGDNFFKLIGRVLF